MILNLKGENWNTHNQEWNYGNYFYVYCIFAGLIGIIASYFQILKYYREKQKKKKIHQEIIENENNQVLLNQKFVNKKNFDWGNVVDIDNYYGRNEEGIKLKKWLLDDKCKVILILMGGILFHVQWDWQCLM